MRDFNDRQSHLFFLMLTFLARHSSTHSRYAELVADRDPTSELHAAASTKTSPRRSPPWRRPTKRHRAACSTSIGPQSLPAERLMTELKQLLAEAGQGGGSAFERDAAAVLRGVEAAARQAGKDAPDNRRAFLDLVGRVIRAQAESREPAGEPEPAPRLIMP